MGERQATVTVLKEDALGRIERIDLADGEDPRTLLRRVACGGRIPGSRWLARRLLARERRALEVLGAKSVEGALDGVPRVCEDARFAALASPGRGAPRTNDVLLREWVEGVALHQARVLPEDFFDRLDELVLALHERGVCHNDLHKEQNVLVGRDGFPHLVDFQLASVHRRRARLFASRARDDLRHVEKHRRRYTRDGRGPRGDLSQGRGHAIRRSLAAFVWRRTVKPAYQFATRRIFGTRDGEARRESSGPWPAWSAPSGPRPSAHDPRSDTRDPRPGTRDHRMSSR
jgi:hypothetical protein